MDTAGESTARDEMTSTAGGAPSSAAANLARNVARNGQRPGERGADPDAGDETPEEHDATWIYKQLGLSPEAYKGDEPRTERRPATPLPPVGRTPTSRPVGGRGLGPGLDFDLAADLAAEDPHESPFPPGSLGRDEDMPTTGPKAKPFVHHQSGTTAPIIPGSVPARSAVPAPEVNAAEAAATDAPEAKAAPSIPTKADSGRRAGRKAAETRAAETRATETRATETRATETRAAETRAAETRATEIRAAESRPPVEAPKPPAPQAERPRPAVDRGRPAAASRPATPPAPERAPEPEPNPFRLYDESPRAGVLPPLPPLPEPLRSTETGRGVRSWDSPLPEDDNRITSDNLTADKVLKGRKPKPTRGWRKGLATMGVNLGPSPKERMIQEFEARVRTPIHGCHRLAVISLKGGVGKTTTIAAVGSMFASLRGDRVIAVDANPDRGTLGEKIVGEVPPATVRDFVGRIPRLTKYSDIREFIGQAGSRLEVLASEADPLASLAFSEQDYRVIAEVLERFYNLILTDCGTGLLHSAMVGVLAKAEQVVIVSSASLDGARSASATLDWLEAHGYQELARESVSVISAVRQKAEGVHISEIEAHFASRTRAVVSIPYDEHLAEGGMIDLDALHPRTYRAYLELAATVADGFARSVGYR